MTKSWGEEIWEKKIKSQDEIGVIHGTNSSIERIKNQTNEIMVFLDKKFLNYTKKGGSLLDIGVGPMARFAIEFSKRGYKVTGMDISKTTLGYASKYIAKSGEKINLFRGDLLNSKNFDKKFDIIFCIETFFHIPKHLSLIALRNFNKGLNRKGYIIIQVSIEKELNPKDILFNFLYSVGHKIKKFFRKGFYVNVSRYREDELNDLINRTGFKIIKRRGELLLLKKFVELNKDK